VQVGVSVSQAEAAALFRRFGFDVTMPYERFAHILLTQPARQLAEDMPGVCVCLSKAGTSTRAVGLCGRHGSRCLVHRP
jgi:hypothetical protein